MTIVSVQAKLTTEDLMAAFEELEPAEAEKILRRMLLRRAERKASHLSEREAELLRKIYLQKRAGFQERFDFLNEKSRTFTLTAEEHEELLRLVAESEEFTVRRLEALGELAQLRQIKVPALMKQLGLKAPSVGRCQPAMGFIYAWPAPAGRTGQ